MTKAELAASIAEKTKITKTQAELAITAFIEIVSDALVGGDTVTLVGFGTLKVTERSAREGRNPRTGESIPIPASKAVKLTVGKALRDKLNPVQAKPAPKAAEPARPAEKGKGKKR
jgi:DNA-binding protein HU-beta